MSKINTVAAKRLRSLMREEGFNVPALASQTQVSRYTIENILSGKSQNIESLIAIGKTFNKPISYFLDEAYVHHDAELEEEYDIDLHQEILHMINDVCKESKTSLSIEKINNLTKLIYPRLKKTGDRGKIAQAYVAAVIESFAEEL
jgi:transcriptional regulator with XRE-family HTH domain